MIARLGLDRPGRQLALLLLVGWLPRLALAALAEYPGLYDPNHYFNLARSLLAGRGFVIDYIWQYHSPPAALTHPTDYWQPLAALWPALSMAALGESVLAALLPTTLLGTALAALAWGIARAARLSPAGQIMAAGLALFIPEFMLGAVRTDTAVSYALWVGLSLLCFAEGLRQRPPLLALAGFFGGLACLTRIDGLLLLPTFAIALVFWRRGSGRRLPWRWLALMALALALTMAPWLWRNWQALGVLMPASLGRTLFLTHVNEQFAYGAELTAARYLEWGWPNILGNIALHALSNIKQAYVSLDIALPALALLGLAGLALRRERDILLLLAAPLALWALLYLFYTALVPFFSMSGSFKKSQFFIIPWLAVAAAWALETYLRPPRIAHLLAAIIVAFTALNGVEFVRQEMKVVRAYIEPYQQLRAALRELGDADGDGQITVMGEDPWILNYYGFPALVTPYDDREHILAAARRYGADYLLLLPDYRPGLNALYDAGRGAEMDARFPVIARVAHFRIVALAEAGTAP